MTTTTELETDFANLRAIQNQQKALVAAAPNRKTENAARAQLVRIQEEIAEVEARIAHREALDAKLASGSQVKVSGRVTRLRCHKARRELGKDEPLLYIATFDFTRTISIVGFSVPIPAVNVVVVGPWLGVGKNQTHRAGALEDSSRPDFWNTEGKSQPIANPQDVMVIAALAESDKSSHHAIRGVVRTQLETAMANNLSRDYDSLVDTMLSNMQGAIESSKGVLGLAGSLVDADDLLGRPRHVALTRADVDELQRACVVEKRVEFEQKNRRRKVVNHYTVTFRFGP